MFRFKSVIVMLMLTLSVWATDGNGHFHMSFKQQNVPVQNVEQQFATWFSLPEQTVWQEISRNTDQLGMTRIEYRQFVAGVEVEHSQILLHVKDGQVLSANGTVMEQHRSPSATTRKKASKWHILSPFSGKLYLIDSPDGYIYARKVSSGNREWIYYDAETGAELKRVPMRFRFTDDDTSVTVEGNGLYLGKVTMDGIKQDYGSIGLHDTQRRIYTIPAGNIQSLDTLAAHGQLGDYFPANMIPSNIDKSSLKHLLYSVFDSLPDLTKYLLSGGIVSTNDNQFYAYRLKSVKVERAKAVDENGKEYDLTPSKGILSSCRIQLFYKQTDGVLYDFYYYMTNSDGVIMIDDVANSDVILTREGVTLTLSIGKHDENYDGGKFIRKYTVSFLPDDSGKMIIDRDDLKATIEYEKCGSPAVDVHKGMEATYDFYKNVLGRDSYDDKGSPIYNIMYFPSELSTIQRDTIGFLDDEGLHNSAYYIEPMPSQDEEDIEKAIYVFESVPFNAAANYLEYNPWFMSYGMGGRYKPLGSIFMRPMVELSVMAHEFTHLVTRCTANLEYFEESGALNESFSDIIGISVAKSDDYGYGSNYPWAVGAYDVFVGFSNIRDFANPHNSMDGKNPCPGTYKGLYWLDENGESEVHNQSGVMNKFYYLLCNGDTGTNDHGYNYSVTGIGIDKGVKIAYRTLVQYATEESDYADIRNSYIEAATDLYGASSNEVEAVKKAWSAVGVYGDEDPSDVKSAISVSNTKANDAVYDLQGRRIETPTSGLYIKNGRKYVVK